MSTDRPTPPLPNPTHPSTHEVQKPSIHPILLVALATADAACIASIFGCADRHALDFEADAAGDGVGDGDGDGAPIDTRPLPPALDIPGDGDGDGDGDGTPGGCVAVCTDGVSLWSTFEPSCEPAEQVCACGDTYIGTHPGAIVCCEWGGPPCRMSSLECEPHEFEACVLAP